MPARPLRCPILPAPQRLPDTTHEASFLRDWGSMDHELNCASRSRKYGFELVNLDVPSSAGAEAGYGSGAENGSGSEGDGSWGAPTQG